jgi:hypothetical protein
MAGIRLIQNTPWQNLVVSIMVQGYLQEPNYHRILFAHVEFSFFNWIYSVWILMLIFDKIITERFWGITNLWSVWVIPVVH